MYPIKRWPSRREDHCERPHRTAGSAATAEPSAGGFGAGTAACPSALIDRAVADVLAGTCRAVVTSDVRQEHCLWQALPIQAHRISGAAALNVQKFPAIRHGE